MMESFLRKSLVLLILATGMAWAVAVPVIERSSDVCTLPKTRRAWYATLHQTLVWSSAKMGVLILNMD